MATGHAAALIHLNADSAMAEETEHFERRLTEETSKVRLEMADLRTDMATGFGAVRTEIAGLRTEMHTHIGDVRTEIAGLRSELQAHIGGVRTDVAAVRTEIAANKFELLKWAFVFWVGQLAAVAGIVGWLLRIVPPR